MAKTRTFSIGTIPEDQKFRGQAKLIVDFMTANPGSTVPQIATGIKEGLVTRQDPERVVAFYMSVWKKKKYVTLGEAEATETAAVTDGDEAGDEDEGDEDAEIDEESAASTGATTEERMAAAAEADLESATERISQELKVSDAVMRVLNGEKATVEVLVEKLVGRGYNVKAEQVQGALNNLVRRGQVAKAGGMYGTRGR